MMLGTEEKLLLSNNALQRLFSGARVPPSTYICNISSICIISSIALRKGRKMPKRGSWEVFWIRSKRKNGKKPFAQCKDGVWRFGTGFRTRKNTEKRNKNKIIKLLLQKYAEFVSGKRCKCEKRGNVC